MSAYTKIFFALSLIMLILSESIAPVTGAEFQVIRPGSTEQNTTVLVVGELLPNDNKRFIASTIDIDNAVVVFSSNGGKLIAGLEIGKAIRLKNFSTYVPANTLCASACAIAWVGGTQRFMSRSAMIGFHAAYVNNQNGPTETGMGNALVGAYFNSLGLPNKAVAYMTVASPDSMQWLSFDDAQNLGLNVTLFDAIKSKNVESATKLSNNLHDHEEWTTSWGQGVSEYKIKNDNDNYFYISCDSGYSESHDLTGIGVAIKGKSPEENTKVKVIVDEDEIIFRVSEGGGIRTDCTQCSDNFVLLWSKLKNSHSLRVQFSNGDNASFSLRGVKKALGDMGVCPTSAMGRQDKSVYICKPFKDGRDVEVKISEKINYKFKDDSVIHIPNSPEKLSIIVSFPAIIKGLPDVRGVFDLDTSSMVNYIVLHSAQKGPPQPLPGRLLKDFGLWKFVAVSENNFRSLCNMNMLSERVY